MLDITFTFLCDYRLFGGPCLFSNLWHNSFSSIVIVYTT